VAAVALGRMASAIRYGGAEVVTWIDKPIGVYLGLKTRAGTPDQGVLSKSETGEMFLAFAGESLPDGETGSDFPGRSRWQDAGRSSCFSSYNEEAPFLRVLNGRFHGLLINRRQGTALLFNDRYGMHRLYYHEGPDAFYFASEAKAILAVRPELRRMEERGLGEFVSCGAVLEDRTIFQGIRALPPASSWVFRSGRLDQKHSYFQPKEWEEQETLDGEAFYQELRGCFVRSLPRYFSCNHTVGMSLTGGLDTRMVMANWKAKPGSLPCYTFGSMYRENQDVRVARRVAEACGQPFRILTASSAFLSQFSSYAERAIFLTDGCVEVSRAPDLYLNEKAREIAPVRMTGLYGGEILRGVRAFKPVVPAPGLFDPGFSSQLHVAERTYADVARCHPVSFAAFRQGPWYLRNSLVLEQTQLSMRTPFLDNEFVRTVFRAPASALSSNEISFRLIADGNPKLLSIPTDRGLTPKSGMAHLAHELSFKAEYAYDMGMPQWLARLDHAGSALHLERAFLGRHKPFHFRIWYRDALASYIQHILLDARSLSRPHIERKGLCSLVRNHVRGIRNHTHDLHKLLTVELVYRIFIDETEIGEESGSQMREICVAPPSNP